MPIEPSHACIQKIVARIPRGRVATYGQIARLAGLPGQARLVGYALHALPDFTPVPWQRVVNARGEISTRGAHGVRQRRLLEREGVVFDSRRRISLDRFQWRPRARGLSQEPASRVPDIRPPIPSRSAHEP
jgi:methylated-DNA-protein-cysteine methyltransferase related protein